jgi:threonine dehydrogenase-like Zn-dependent dehydrogenase
VAYRREHRQYFVVDAEEALLIPDGVSDEAATWFGLATITQNGIRRAQHDLGDSIVVIGLGLLGQLVVQYLKVSGAREFIAIDTSPARLAMAKAHGATHILETDVVGAREAVEEVTNGRMADVVYDITGHPTVFSPALG